MVRRREREELPERVLAERLVLERRDEDLAPFRLRDVAVPRRLPPRREREDDDLDRDREDAERDPLRERELELDLRVAIRSSLLHSQTMRYRGGLRSLSDWLHPAM